MTPFASTLPSNDGYVAAAYIVFFALLLIYLVIMAIRLGRVEQRLQDMNKRREPQDATPPTAAEDASERETLV